MPQYLLLRDNKQSGPYSFEELTVKGLKAYDLIWVEGKSAAWRYPSEVEELKPFAPVVEEQPYDRFYKRQDGSTKKQAETSSKPVEYTQVKTPEPAKVTPSRKIVVILPGGQYREGQQDRVVFNETVENKIKQPEKKTTTTQQPVGLEEIANYKARDREERSALPTYPEKNRVRSKSGFFNSKASKVVSGTLVLMLIAGFIGWAFTHTNGINYNVPQMVKPAQSVQIEEPKSVYNNEAALAVNNQLVNDEPVQPDEQAFIDSLTGETSTLPLVTEPVVKQVSKPKITPKVKENTVSEEPVTEPLESEATMTHKASAIEHDDVEKRSAKRNINDLVKVAKNDYKVGPFGGVSDIQLKVTNSSSYPVDLVVVEVKYLLANKKEFKTENLYFKNLAPGASLTKEAPKSPRGIKVESKVALITSKALGMYQASL